MRIASFNVENLFERAKALDPEDWAAGRPILELHSKINRLLAKPKYTDKVKKDILDTLDALGVKRKDDGGEFAVLRQNRGKLLARSGGKIKVIANGRADWVGWVDLKTEPVDELATRHTAMVIKDVGADVTAVIEADDRPSLRDFSSIMMRNVGGTPFEHVMLIDGNDSRGIDVGILTRAGFEIQAIETHVDDTDGNGRVFSRDCPAYMITTPAGNEVVVLINHLKSKGFGKAAASNERRRQQALAVSAIYKDLRDRGYDRIAVVGDLNDTPDSAPLKPLIQDTDLHDISEHPRYEDDGRPGTYANGTKGNKIDYVLLSPALFVDVEGGGVFRKGVWGGKHGTLFPHYDSMQNPHQAASDHAAIYADIGGL